jgi:hypothetical protein
MGKEINVIRNDSPRNCLNSELLDAPKTFLIPISVFLFVVIEILRTIKLKHVKSIITNIDN